jgi:lipoyl synthase
VALAATQLRVVPHVVIGLHYGQVLGEFAALEIIGRHRVDACILVVVMPAFTRPGRFRAPDTDEVADDHRRAQLELRVAFGTGKLPDDALAFPTPLKGADQSPRAFSK